MVVKLDTIYAVKAGEKYVFRKLLYCGDMYVPDRYHGPNIIIENLTTGVV